MNNAILFIIIAVGIVLILVTALAVRRKPGRPGIEAAPVAAEKDQPGKLPEEPEPPAARQAPVVPAEVLEAPRDTEAPVEMPPAPSVLEPEAAPPSRLSAGLAKTKHALGRTLSGITRRDRLTDQDWEDVEAALISADVGIKATAAIVNALRGAKPSASGLPDALKYQLVKILNHADRELNIGETKPAIWLVTGVNGVGKTTSIAKLAKRLTGDGHQVVLAAADTFRAAAIDQLGTWADRIGIHMVRHNEGSDPGAVVFDAIEHAKAKGAAVVIVDTAGRLHTKSNLMEELKKVRRIAEREGGSVAETLLVLDATVGQNGISQARSFQEAVEVTGVVLAKLDGSAKGGIVVAIQDELGIPVKAVGLGEQIDDLEPFDPERFAAALVEGL